jgi:acetolactate synthase-1/2/3 large subunit
MNFFIFSSFKKTYKLNKYKQFFTSTKQLVINSDLKDIKNKNKKITLSGSDIVFNTLKNNNVEQAFIYSGGSIMPIIDKFYKSSISYIVNSHEQNCGHAATGYSKSSDKKCVVLVTSGPGFTNTITPLLDATNDSTPLVIISGQVSKSAIGTNAFQEAPSVQLSKNVTKWSYQVKDINELNSVINKAFDIAYNGKKGAVHIDIPKCVSSDIIEIDYDKFQDFFTKKKKKNKQKTINLIIDDKFKKTIELINNSEKPIIYLGQGCIDSYELLREFAIKSNIPVTSTIHGNGIFDEDHQLSLQWCGMHGSPASNFALQQADTIIALGSRFDDRTTGNISKYAPKCFEAYQNGTGGIIHVNIEKSEINKVINSHYNFNTNCHNFLVNALKLSKFNKREKWINNINNLKQTYKFKVNNHKKKIYMENVLLKLYNKTKHLEDNVIFTTGVGNHQMQTYQFIKSHYPKKILSSGSLGVMGVGLPYSIGSQLANKDKMVICIDGDSSFNMTLTDMKTIVENNLPIKIAVMNNESQMMVTIWEKLFFNQRYTATINKRNPDFTTLAEGYGIKSLSCDNINNLDNVVNEFISYNKGPILCEFKIEKSMCLPLVAPGKALDEMIMEDDFDLQINEGIAPS